MELVIFEDNQTLAFQIQDFLIKKFEREISSIFVTDNLDEILNHISQQKVPCIYILDIYIIDRNDGIFAAQEIYHSGDGCQNYIILITQYPEKILFDADSKMKANNIILKHKSTFFQELLITIQMILKMEKETSLLVFHDYFDEIRIATKDILLIATEKGTKKIQIIHENGSCSIRKSLDSILQELDSDFFRCHNSYIVNLRKIRKVVRSTRQIFMTNGSTCYYSYTKQKSFFKKLKGN